MKTTLRAHNLLFGCVLGVASCTGAIGDSATNAGGPDGTGGAGGGSAGANAPPAHPPQAQLTLLPRRVWRLTRVQYDNTVQDLLGDTTRPAQSFIAEEGGTGFDNAEQAIALTTAHYAEFIGSAQRLAKTTIDSRLETVWPCAADKLTDEGCAKKFIAEFGQRAFRRPLETAEVDAWLSAYKAGIADCPGSGGLQAVLEGFLSSPSFLFRSELGDKSGRLTGHELASALSYTVWGTMPDSALLKSANDGSLLSPAVLEREVARMLADPRARETVADFYVQLLRLSSIDAVTKDPAAYPAFAAAKPFMIEETRRFVGNVIFEEHKDLRTLLTAPYSFVNAPLAHIYGVSATGNDFVRVELDPTQRAGILTQAAVMSVHATATQSSPVRRGKLVAEQLLCFELPDPPAGVDITEPKITANGTTRQRFEQHSSDASCAGCHKLLDPLGFPFEHLDAIGRSRTQENGQTVDTSTVVEVVDGLAGSFSGIRDVAEALAGSARVRECLARQTLRYASGRLETDGDEKTLEDMTTKIVADKDDPLSLLRSYLASDAFLYRKIDLEEAL